MSLTSADTSDSRSEVCQYFAFSHHHLLVVLTRVECCILTILVKTLVLRPELISFTILRSQQEALLQWNYRSVSTIQMRLTIS